MTAPDESPRCDLHCHSNQSDGTETPTRLAQLAKKQGLAGFSLTDHDTVSGLPEASREAVRLGLHFLSGIEISSKMEGQELHILGYGFDPENPALLAAMKNQHSARKRRVPAIVEKFIELGIEITAEQVFRIAGEGSPGRPHVARAVVELGVCKSVPEVFEKYLHDQGPANVVKETLSTREAIELIHQAGGVAVLAHPTAKPIRATGGLDTLVGNLANMGLDGLELHHPKATPHNRKRIGKLIRKHSLLASGGSDFHGDNSPSIQMGVGRGSLKVPFELLSDLEARATNLH
ncbi:MAG: PHP domain-containing protein [Deltaproteobacteria bacterium]|nr:PHP domain-containing protein [Deltaproteobacteria bacterium]